ncbi:MAG: T9SS type A sorting domain-containing protein [Salegentibacter sp.]|uniref:T9SS type A sorting domain-containing protein n=1 Tax=Salegentibacter sp. TaxID=1903072 RepID=UPI002870A3A4|nr:T9SS type A sorting domain-containing protein [Salegentibacter sp.]MDR9457804.1 T9SS type A sorting domain-containing protein [Salegentibacter sp.]
MKVNSLRFYKLLKITLLVMGVSFAQLSFSQNDWKSTGTGNWNNVSWSQTGLPDETSDVTLENGTVTIPEAQTVIINSLVIGKNSYLDVQGTLVVKGNVTMTNNSQGFNMGDNSAVIIYGDFEVNNQVSLSLESYLIIYGQFIAKGSSNHTFLNIDQANIYIFDGLDGNGWPDSFNCDGGQDYTGTPDIGIDCDFGSTADYEDNQESFPDDLVDLINCFDLSDISSQTVCQGETATFSVAPITDSSVNYQWQEKIGEANWTNIGTDSPIYSLENTSVTDSGKLYRLIVKPTDPANSSCKISISRNVSLVVQQPGVWTGEVDTNWNNEENWSCKRIPDLQIDVIIPAGLQNYPEIKVGANALSNDLTIETGASVLVDNNWLRIAGSLMNSQNLNVETGSISFEGTAAQTIPAAAFKNNRIQNLNINNSLGVISEAIIEVTGMLKVETGNFETGNQLTLISDATQTALIDGSGTGQVIGNVTMQRYLDNSFGYKYFATPFNASKVGDFSDIDLAETFPNFYRYDENRRIDSLDLDATGWEAYIDPVAALNVMEGYALNFGASTNPLTVSLTGEVNNGDYSLVLENNNGEYTKGFHLVGNPYPSPIDWNASGWTKTNIDNQIHFFTAGIDNRYTGTYESFVNGVAQNGGSATSIISSMQGFFVKVSDSDTDTYPVTGTLGINNTTRVNNFTQEFYRNQEPAPKSLIRLDASFKGESGKDGMVIYFENQASQDFESQLDAHKLMNTDVNVPNLYSLSPDGQQLSINAVARPEDKKETIPLGITTERGGTMSISLKDLENLPYDFAVFLKDKEKNKTVDLRKQAYSFEVKKGENNSRFELLFSNESILTKEDLDDEFFSVFSSDGKMQVELNLEEEKEGVLRLSTVTGQLLETKAGRGKEQVSFDGISSSGVYFVILEKDGKRYTKKVLIRK